MVGPSGRIAAFGAARLPPVGGGPSRGIPAELDPESHAESARRGHKFELPCALARHP
jgi:hypothetical protein